MELLDRMTLFNSTILVLWAVVFIPYALNAQKVWLIGLCGVFLIPFEVFLYWEIHDYPYNILMGIGAFFLALAGGYLMHYSNQRRERKSKL